MKRKGTLQFRSLTDVQQRVDSGSDGTFEGYACVWDVMDTYGTTWRRGCFEAGGLDGGLYALLRMHDPMRPVGTFEAAEDDHGLRIGGAYDDTNDGRDARACALSGSMPGLSVGFVWLDSDPSNEDYITSARLVETSQITARMASVPGAQLDAVRSALLSSSLLGIGDLPISEARRRQAMLTRTRLRLALADLGSHG